MKRYHSTLAMLVLLITCIPTTHAASTARTQAKEILDMTGLTGGVIVHLGCGDGKLAAALHASDAFTVNALDADPGNVEQARRNVQSLGLYGPVSAQQFSGSTLPYTDNLINLVVVHDAGKVPMSEIIRVLAPGGCACILQNGKWKKVTRDRPDTIDDWTHFLHDASNNAVANDTEVGPPRSLQWIAPPLWLRSHETPSGIQAPISANGRLFYIFDEGLIGIVDERLPDRWSLVCRDAFNGRLLWKRPLGDWGWRQWNLKRWQGKDWTTLRSARTDVPNENHRRIVADGDRVYTTLSYCAEMSILNAATGRVIKTVPQTEATSEILVSDGVAVAYVKPQDVSAARLVAADGRTGKVLWDKQVGLIRPLALAIDNGRVVFISGRNLTALDLKNGDRLWQIQPGLTSPKTLLTVDDIVAMQAGKRVEVYNAVNGEQLWQKNVPPIGGGEGDDFFVIDGLLWRGMLSVDESGKPAGKSPNVLMIGWDPRTGQEKKRIHVNNLRSPEHHHRCYRNKATIRFLISSYEGAEYLDLQEDDHSQNNWLRGACRNGMVPCNGMLYAPPDQCFCQPGAKLLGYAAVKTEPDEPLTPLPDTERLVKGPAYGKVTATGTVSKADWPTYRHDPARTGTTKAPVPTEIKIDWRVPLKGKLTTPVAANGRVFVAEEDSHTLHALVMTTGRKHWQFTTNGRIDSPPTIHKGMVLLGSKDGWVYCLRETDGQLVWKFLAAPCDRRVGYFDQIESTWPVHGSILVENDVAYFTAGRSTYLDGGIRVYALDPATGKILHKGLLEGPHPAIDGQRDVAFYILGANSDVLVGEGGYIYMRQKKMTPNLKEVKPDVLSSKGAQDVGLHIFSTAGLLDGSWYNRTFWMYSKRWPGFQLANQAPKTGQLLVVDDEKTYAVRVFYRRNVHSPMFFPAREGYLLFADRNTNEPQIVGEPGSREPLKWLPQSDYSRARGNQMRALESEAFGLDKMIGYTRAEEPVWTNWLPVRIRAMVKAGQTLFVAGPPDVFDENDPFAAFEGRGGAKLLAVSAKNGKELYELPLEHPPVFDGMIAAQNRLFVSLEDGSIVCLSAAAERRFAATIPNK